MPAGGGVTVETLMEDRTPRPMDYYNPLARPEPAEPAPAAPPGPKAVVPLEFDTVLTHSSDHPAVAAIEAAMRIQQIPTHRVTDGQIVGGQVFGGQVTLYVRAQDYAVAAPVAAAVFVRRQRVKAMNPPKPTHEADSVVMGGVGPFDLVL